MAGIGFELRKLTSDNSFIGLIRANFYSSILSNGSWIISISILVAIYFYLSFQPGSALSCIQFLVAISYLVSSSLILSAIFQHCVNRYIADKIFEERQDLVCPALLLSGFILLISSFVIGFILVETLLYNQPLLIKLLMLSSFVVLNLIWLFSNSLTGMKNYRFILLSYTGSYLLVFLLAVVFYRYKLSGLLLAFYIGHAVLLTLFLVFLLRNYLTNSLFRLEILDFMKINKSLIFSGVFFQLGMWIDKYCFWFAENTSMPILDSIRSSPIYDMPMFLAFIIMIPGLSVFFYEIEANFSRYYHRFYDGIRNGATIEEINKKHAELISLTRNCFFNIFKVQSIIAIFACMFAPEIIHLLGLAPVFSYLLRIDVISASLLVILISQINVLYYLDKKNDVCITTMILFFSSLIFTILSIYLGPSYYGYGFAVALVCSNFFAVFRLNDAFKKIIFFSFMSN